MIAYLKKEDGQKDQEIDALKQQVKDIRVTAHNERDNLITQHEQKITQLEKALLDRSEEVSAMLYSLATRLYTTESSFSKFPRVR